MNTLSPLRYPGGKASMAGLLRRVRRLNHLSDRPLVEPFAGGAGASLALLFAEEVPEIVINDADPALLAFWWVVINQPAAFSEQLRDTPVSIREWRTQRAVYRSRRITSLLRKGFATFYLNRCNRSGIIVNGGPIGGVKQTGRWKIGARFNKPELLRRCARLADFGERIRVSGADGIELLSSSDHSRTMFFIDPPYYHKGQTLYMNSLGPEYHEALANELRSRPESAWLLTYDDCPEIRSLYKGWSNVRSFGLRYTAAGRRPGREVLVTPKWMRLPRKQSSLALQW